MVPASKIEKRILQSFLCSFPFRLDYLRSTDTAVSKGMNSKQTEQHDSDFEPNLRSATRKQPFFDMEKIKTQKKKQEKLQPLEV